jgi:hypothetical protein
MCLEGTRGVVLDEIQVWSEGRDDEGIFWLNGIAGTGKSTIARTVAKILHDQGRLGASFFFVKGAIDLDSANAFVTTLALQISDKLPDLKPHICNAIESHGDIGQQFLHTQWNNLPFQPVLILEEKMLPSLALVLVIDALD